MNKHDRIAQAIKRLPLPNHAPDKPTPAAPAAPPTTLEQRVNALEQRIIALESRQMMMFYLLVINTALVVVTDTPRVAEIIKTLLLAIPK
jgi:hypothetical protein